MTKFSGAVGYGTSTELSPGVWDDVMTERQAYGDVKRNARTFVEGRSINDDLVVNNSISIVLDAYSSEHFHNIRYVLWGGVRWKVTEVTEERPRLLLRLGGKWDGPIPDPDTP